MVTTAPDLLTDQADPTAPVTLVPPPAPGKALAAVPVTEDIIEYTLACALALSPPDVRAYLRQHVASQVSGQARKVFGGDRIYIGKSIGDSVSDRNEAIKRDWQRGERYSLLERRYKLGKTRLWQIINS